MFVESKLTVNSDTEVFDVLYYVETGIVNYVRKVRFSFTSSKVYVIALVNIDFHEVQPAPLAQPIEIIYRSARYDSIQLRRLP